MPELPEVETMVRGIRPSVEGREIIDLCRCRCSCKPLSVKPSYRQLKKRMVGTTVDTVRRRAKRVVLDLSSGDSLVIEPRMTGMLVLRDPPDKEHLRYEWKFGDSSHSHRRQNVSHSLWFWDRRGLGTIQLYSSTEIEEVLGPTRIGPDALEMSKQDWRACCEKTRRAIKVAMLDQKLVAGIGNLYASEILHHAGIHPSRPADGLKRREVRQLHLAADKVLREAIRYEGSTLNDGTYRNALNQSGQYQNEHRVYNRQDQPCLTCGETPIQRIVQSQRSTFFCPTCQK